VADFLWYAVDFKSVFAFAGDGNYIACTADSAEGTEGEDDPGKCCSPVMRLVFTSGEASPRKSKAKGFQILNFPTAFWSVSGCGQHIPRAGTGHGIC